MLEGVTCGSRYHARPVRQGQGRESLLGGEEVCGRSQGRDWVALTLVLRLGRYDDILRQYFEKGDIVSRRFAEGDRSKPMISLQQYPMLCARVWKLVPSDGS
jgi:hypothetical protein